MYENHEKQGSWAHATIINPVGAYDEFDADILLTLTKDDDWDAEPKKYLQEVRAAFKRHPTYKSMVRRKNRCVRIGYANDCHVDVVPSIILSTGRQVIISYKDNDFEDTNPVGFAEWMKERDSLANEQLRRCIRLLKWLRDYKNTFSCPSVILTVMLGNRVRIWDLFASYKDIPTALVNFLEDLNAWLDLHASMPLLDDPSCPGVSFNHRWDEPQYLAFKRKIADYALWAREAYDLQDEDDSAALTAWQKLFGVEFAADEVQEARSREIQKKAIASRTPSIVESGDVPARPATEQFIQERYSNLNPRYDAQLRGFVEMGMRRRNLRLLRGVERNRQLIFELHTETPEPYDVLWKVRNFGLEASRRPGQLRGEIRFGGSERRNLHRESTSYRGVHYVEAYVVKDGAVVASDHHDVRII